MNHHSAPSNRRAPLRAALAAYTAADAREEGFRTRMLDLLDAEGDPFAREHFAPGHFTASAFILSPDRAHLLMILHQKLHLWLQPGGHVDPDDPDVFASVLREIHEETGLTGLSFHGGAPALFDIDIHLIPARKADPAHHHFDLRALLVAHTTDLQAGSDATDARWVPLDAISPEDTDESVLRAVRKLRALLEGPPAAQGYRLEDPSMKPS